MRGLRARFLVEVLLAGFSFLVCLLTILWQDWIEIIFGVDPDHHNGAVEWGVVALSALVATIFAVLAGVEFRRPRLTAS